VKVIVPENAHLSVAGHDWICDSGFRLQRNGCVAMTATELAANERLIEESARQREELVVPLPASGFLHSRDGTHVACTALGSSFSIQARRVGQVEQASLPPGRHTLLQLLEPVEDDVDAG
jgi:hypothetical protein